MTSIKTKIAAIVTSALMMVTIFPATGYARSANASIQVSPEKIETGSLFTVTVTFTATDDTIGTLQASLQYDADKMEYKSGGGNAIQLSNGSGGISDNGSETAGTVNYTLNFLALKTGTAHFAVTGSEIIGYESSAKLGNPKAEASITIVDAPKPSPTATSMDTPNLLQITVGGKTYFLQQDISAMDLPEGFVAQKYFFQGKEIQAAIHPGAGVTLIYLMDAAGSAGFYIYDVPMGVVYPFAAIQASDAAYTILPGGTAPEGYETATIEIGGMTVPGWKRSDGDTAFFVVHAKDVQGAEGYYIYDKTEGTLQRAKTDMALPVQSGNEIQTDTAAAPPEDQGGILLAICLLTALLVLFTAAAILLGVRVKRKSRSNRE
jgi:hypothetical protein